MKGSAGLLLLAFLIASTFFPAIILAEGNLLNPLVVSLDYKDVIDEIRFERVWQYMADISDESLGSRMTGYPGSEASADYIRGVFEELDIPVEEQWYDLTIPMDRGSTITVMSPEHRSFAAFALWPNHVQTSLTPPEGLTGKLVYVGRGDLYELDGREIDGGIVLMEFNSGDNWINLANFGAKAIIFIEPYGTTRFEAERKSVRVPLYLPRLYVSKEVGEYLKGLKGNVTVNVKVNMRFETVRARNVIGVIEGDVADEIIVIAAHYDTWSVVPSLAFGVDETAGISTLLELANYFSQHKPKRTVWLVALSGHWQALAGARAFVDRYYFDEEVVSGKKKMWMFIGLDFSSDSNTLGVLWKGYFYSYGTLVIAGRFNWIERTIFQRILPDMGSQLGETFAQLVEDGFDFPWTAGSSPDQGFMLDSEAFSIARGVGFTFRTTKNAYRYAWGHPLSGGEAVNRDNLRPQVIVSVAAVYYFANTDTMELVWSDISPVRVFISPGGLIAGFVTLKGRVSRYDVVRGWYEPVPNALVVTTSKPASRYAFADMITYADKDGNFSLMGAGMGFAISGWVSAAVSMRFTVEAAVPGVGYFTQAYVFNATTGQMEYAPDLGQFGAQAISFWSNADQHPSPANTVVFKASPAALFDILNPERLSRMGIWDPRIPDKTFVWTDMTLLLYDFKEMSEYRFYGTQISRKDGLAMLYVPPGTRFMIVIDAGFRRSIVLVNASKTSPEGDGYLAKPGEELHLTFSVSQMVRDLLYVSDGRYQTLNMSFVRSPISELSFRKVWDYYNKLVENLGQRRYGRAYAYATSAWLWGISAYSETLRLLNDTSYVLLFFFIMAMSFAFLFERLVFAAMGKKRMIVLFILLSVNMIALYYANPILQLAASPMIGIMGLALIFFLGIMLAIVLSETQSMMMVLRERFLGKHFVEEKKLTSFAILLDVGIRNMKKRKMRTLLISITILTITFGMASLTSAQLFVGVVSHGKPQQGTYDGIYVKRGDIRPANFLGEDMDSYVRGIVPEGAFVSSRAWYYPASTKGIVKATITSSNMSFPVFAVLGVSAEEAMISPSINSSILEGRWFENSDYGACLIGKEAQEALGVRPGGVVTLGSIPLVVVGIYDSLLLDRTHTDLDTRLITPLDPNQISAISLAAVPYESFNPVSWGSVIVVPYRMARDYWDANLASISVKLEDEDTITRLASEISMTMDVEVYTSYQGQVRAYSRILTGAQQGLGIIAVPVLIGAATVLNTMLGLIQERKKEIGIVSSLGLSPRGIVEMFLTEASVYAVISAILGYLAGVVVNVLLISSRILPIGFILNYSSLIVVLTISISMSVTLISTILPAYMASTIVTPSLERKWKVTTRPVDGEWDIALPLAVEERSEADGILVFLHEFFQAYMIETPMGFSVRELEIDVTNSTIRLVAALRPYDAGVTQEATIRMQYSPQDKKYGVLLHLRHLTGPRKIWMSSNYSFIDAIRKQTLTWRLLKAGERLTYIKRSQKT